MRFRHFHRAIDLIEDICSCMTINISASLLYFYFIKLFSFRTMGIGSRYILHFVNRYA